MVRVWRALPFLARHLDIAAASCQTLAKQTASAPAPSSSPPYRLLSAYAAAAAAEGGRTLVRDFIHDSLYNSAHGYFSNPSVPVGTLRQPIDFGSLYGQGDYLRRVQQTYQDLKVSWLTPVEIFQPYYGSAIARYLVQHHTQGQQRHEQHGIGQHRQQQGIKRGQQQQQQQQGMFGEQPLRVYEIGGGTGTLARNVLDWLRQHHAALYASCRYTCIEISPSLARRQHHKVAVEGGHNDRFEVVQEDGASASAWGAASEESCYIIMMEVLDNLPHDRVWRPHPGSPWQQTLVAAESAPSAAGLEGAAGQHAAGWLPAGECGKRGPLAGLVGSFREVLEPAVDPLILRCLDCLTEEQEAGGKGVQGWGMQDALRGWMSALMQGGDTGGPGEAVFLPTGCLQLLDTLHRLRPRHHLIAADFDELPEVAIPGRNAPLVATTAGGRTIDHDTYLVPPGTADIFFPTDFSLLRRLYADAAAQRVCRTEEPVAAGEAQHGVVAAARHLKTPEFMRRFGDAGATRTRSGYDPLLEDYSNTAFFLASATA